MKPSEVTSIIDAKLRRILAPFKIVRAKGQHCLACGAETEFTYDERCGICFLENAPKRLN